VTALLTGHTIGLIAECLTSALSDARKGDFMAAGTWIALADQWISECYQKVDEPRDRARLLKNAVSVECRVLQREMVVLPKPKRRKAKRKAQRRAA
jgi:hypothetical protein